MVTGKPMECAVFSFLPKNPAPRPKGQWCAPSPQEEQPPSQWCASFLWFPPEGRLGVSATSAVAMTPGPGSAPAAGGAAGWSEPGPSRRSPKDSLWPGSWGCRGSRLGPEEERASCAFLFSVPGLSRFSQRCGPKPEGSLAWLCLCRAGLEWFRLKSDSPVPWDPAAQAFRIRLSVWFRQGLRPRHRS